MKTALLLLSLALPHLSPAAVAEQRCGWVENPTPANYFFVDEEETWTLALQGGYQAPGMQNLPELTLVNEGTGRAACACLDLVVSQEKRRVEEVVAATSKPIAECQNNAALPRRQWREPAQNPVPPPSDPTEPELPEDPETPENPAPPEDPTLPETEIQVYLGYYGADDYAAKYISTLSQVVSAGYLYPDATLRNAACFKGNPQEALRVFEEMVYEMNFLERRRVGFRGWVYFDAADTQRDVIAVNGIENGREFVWFPRIRECHRWSTPEERSRRP